MRLFGEFAGLTNIGSWNGYGIVEGL